MIRNLATDFDGLYSNVFRLFTDYFIFLWKMSNYVENFPKENSGVHEKP